MPSPWSESRGGSGSRGGQRVSHTAFPSRSRGRGWYRHIGRDRGRRCGSSRSFGMVVGVGHVASHIMKDDEGLLAALHACELFGEGIIVDVKVGGGAEVTVSPVLLVGFGGNDGGRGIPGAEADLVADPDGMESGGFGGFDEGGASERDMPLYWFFAVRA